MCNINMMDVAYKRNAGRIFYSSSACIYPERNQMDALHPTTSEDSAYPAGPIVTMVGRNCSANVCTRLTIVIKAWMYVLPVSITSSIRKEPGKADVRSLQLPSAVKVAETPDGGTIEMWGDGNQTRSFLYIDECLEGVRRLMSQDEFMGR